MTAKIKKPWFRRSVRQRLVKEGFEVFKVVHNGRTHGGEPPTFIALSSGVVKIVFCRYGNRFSLAGKGFIKQIYQKNPSINMYIALPRRKNDKYHAVIKELRRI